MNAEADQQGQDNELLNLRLEYWYKRLDHTLQHTQTATRLIYIADGAVLGFCYFWIKELEMSPASIGTAALPVLLLAIINYFHACLIGNQQSWYTGIATRIRALLYIDEVQHSISPLPFCPPSAHKTWQRIHLAMSGALFIAAILMLIWWGTAGFLSGTEGTKAEKQNTTQKAEQALPVEPTQPAASRPTAPAN